MKCTGRNCPMQIGTVDPAHCLAADECPYVTKPLTNADRIRSMTDKEMVELFVGACACLYYDADVCEKWNGACDKCWLVWLKQEVDDGD